ncbi:hypothetical protein AGMMS49983_13470 [Clostridia bacterium]|nr:hypothetical protein AGMMS49983_13470 [Clostridia bacterium]
MSLDYEKDLDWKNATVTPLGRFYNALIQMSIPQEKAFEIIHALTESGAYQESPVGSKEPIPA